MAEPEPAPDPQRMLHKAGWPSAPQVGAEVIALCGVRFIPRYLGDEAAQFPRCETCFPPPPAWRSRPWVA